MNRETSRPLECPIGWVWIEVSTAIEKMPLSGKKLKQSEYQEEGALPVVDQGQTFIGGYTDRGELKAPCELPVIVFGDHTKVLKYVNFDFVAGADGVKAIKPLDAFFPKLFYYFLQAVELPEKGYARHFQFLEKSLIPLPPLREQQRIVVKIEELFTRLDAGVEALKRIKAQLKRYRQSVLKSAFEGKLTAEWRQAHQHELEPASVLLERIKQERHKTAKGKYKEPPPLDTSGLPDLPEGWVWTRLGIIGEINPKLTMEHLMEDVEVTFLPMRCVEELTGQVDASLTRRLSEVRRGYTPFARGDLLFAKITPCMENGKVAIAPDLTNDIGFGSTEFHVIRLSESFHRKLLFYFLVREDLRKDAQRNMTGSAGQLRVPVNYMQGLAIPLAPIVEQHRIVEEIEHRLSVADEIEKTVEHGLKQAERLRQSILKRAFEGKLVPQDPNDEPAEKLLERIKAEKAKQMAEKRVTVSRVKRRQSTEGH